MDTGHRRGGVGGIAEETGPRGDGQEGLFDLKRDPWELESVHDDPRYDTIKGILRSAAEDLADCAGADCRKPVPPLPQPGR